MYRASMTWCTQQHLRLWYTKKNTVESSRSRNVNILARHFYCNLHSFAVFDSAAPNI